MITMTFQIETLAIINLIPNWPKADSVLVNQTTRYITLAWNRPEALKEINDARHAAANDQRLLRTLAKKHSPGTSDTLRTRMENWAEWLRNAMA